MDNKTVHDLAVAFAQVKLFRYLQENPDMSGYSDEIRTFLKAYTHACMKFLLNMKTWTSISKSYFGVMLASDMKMHPPMLLLLLHM